MPRYRFDRDRNDLVEITEAPCKTRNGPFLQPDLPGYQSPVTGAWIEGRAARREDLRRHNCTDARDLK